ncbi:sulfate reduction electron transfer complex DsrMKJOP subunit DsrJ [candidate division CSSED10-310 bacterium]|uniref:Sulfate reduction electron transfer complex DsrMKJOP subunit DsrJ n=1 Tax=candidate division CSSED10-310 bacterium TaxID=2855610 RepID=A0ABV6YS64_UNCC1
MYDSGKIIAGLIIFLILVTSTVWSGKATLKPELQKATQGKKCVAETKWMTANHMDLLNEWRDKVVREGERSITINGVKYDMSLTKTCLKCHTDATKFCDKCHNFLAVEPYCWDCHVVPKGGK